MSMRATARDEALRTAQVHRGPSSDQFLHGPAPGPHADPRARSHWPVGRGLLCRLQHVELLLAAPVPSSVATLPVFYQTGRGLRAQFLNDIFNAFTSLQSPFISIIPNDLFENILIWFNDMLLCASTVEKLLESVRLFFAVCEEYNVKLHPAKFIYSSRKCAGAPFIPLATAYTMILAYWTDSYPWSFQLPVPIHSSLSLPLSE